MDDTNSKRKPMRARTQREIDSELWEKVKELSKGTSDDKGTCVEIIFDNYYKLPNEVDEILKEFASSESEEIRVRIVKTILSKPRITYGLYLSLIDILTEDKSPIVQEMIEEEIKEKKLLISSISSSMIVMSETMSQIANSSRELLFLPQYTIPKIVLPRLQIPPIIWPREIFSQMIEINKFNRSVSKLISGLSSSYYTYSEIQDSYEIEEPEENPLIERLNACPPGIINWKDYQKIVRVILEYTLVPPLAPSTEESETETGVQRRDIIFPIPIDTSKFWEWIRITHSSICVIVDAKNYSDFLPPNQVVINAKYFGNRRLGLFGVLATRKGLNDSARIEQKRLWRDEGKMIVCLNDEDLKRMITLKKAVKNPELVIDEKIRKLRESIE